MSTMVGTHMEQLFGRCVPLPVVNGLHNAIQATITYELISYVKRRKNGAVLPNTQFALGKERLQPDLALFLTDDWKASDLRLVPLTTVPDLVVDIISPDQSAVHVDSKGRAFLRHGVKEVWHFYPGTRTVYVFAIDRVERLEEDSTLTTPLLPGWSLVVGDAFSL